jgi:hypothetical protein
MDVEDFPGVGVAGHAPGPVGLAERIHQSGGVDRRAVGRCGDRHGGHLAFDPPSGRHATMAVADSARKLSYQTLLAAARAA